MVANAALFASTSFALASAAWRSASATISPPAVLFSQLANAPIYLPRLARIGLGAAGFRLGELLIEVVDRAAHALEPARCPSFSRS
jgi:hypothetical protein